MDVISIIVPVYNVSKYLERCINSIISQTYPLLEVILVDDGSEDESSRMCDEYCRKYQNFKVIHKKNGGLGFARNSGLEIVTGKYVTFLDGDDYILPDHIQNLYDKLAAEKADTCLGGYTKVFDSRSDVHKNVAFGKKYEGSQIRAEILSKMFGKSSSAGDYIEMSVCMILYSMNLITSHGLKFHSERELISEDLVFNIEYFQYAEKVSISDDVGYCYCDNEGSLTTRYNPNRFSNQKKLYLYLNQKIKELELGVNAEERSKDTFISIARYAVKLENKFKKENGKDVYRRNVAAICNDELLCEIIDHYDSSKIIFKSRMINWLIRHKQYLLLDWIMTIKNRFGI